MKHLHKTNRERAGDKANDLFKNTLVKFENQLISNSENLEPEYQLIIEEKFWDMIDEIDCKGKMIN